MLYVMRPPTHFILGLGLLSTSYIYDVFLHLLLRLGVIRMQPQPIMLGLTVDSGSRRFSWFLTWIVMCAMMEAPHPVHTHVRSTSYIYNVF
jgi:hypothetical protein